MKIIKFIIGVAHRLPLRIFLVAALLCLTIAAHAESPRVTLQFKNAVNSIENPYLRSYIESYAPNIPYEDLVPR